MITGKDVYMHRDHTVFISAIHLKQKLLVTFVAKEDGATKMRRCAPMDYGPSRKAADGSDRYHVWDYDGSSKNHILSLLPEQILRLEPTDENFDPVEFVRWDTTRSRWFITRDWGAQS